MWRKEVLQAQLRDLKGSTERPNISWAFKERSQGETRNLLEGIPCSGQDTK